jgi:DNA-binding CsgD family transcriptional regulator
MLRWECMKVNSPSVPFVRFNCLNPGRLHPGHTSMIPPSVSVPTFNTVKSCTIRHPISHEWCSQAFSLGDTTSGRAARSASGETPPLPSQSSVLGPAWRPECPRVPRVLPVPGSSPGPERQFHGTSFGDRERRDLEQARLVARYESLTSRERELLPLLVSGLLNKQEAFEMGTEYTVQLHRGHTMRKMQADSFAGLA